MLKTQNNTISTINITTVEKIVMNNAKNDALAVVLTYQNSHSKK